MLGTLAEPKIRLRCWKGVRNTFACLSVNKHISSDTPSASRTFLTRTAVSHITAADEAPGVLSRQETTPSDLWDWLAGSSLGATCDPEYLHERRLFTFGTLCISSVQTAAAAVVLITDARRQRNNAVSGGAGVDLGRSRSGSRHLESLWKQVASNQERMFRTI